MPPASAAPTPQVERSALTTKPRIRAGQVSATSIDPIAHSPLSEKRTSAYIATNIQKLDDIATSGIDSENIAMLMASRLRRPNLSASHGQKYSPAMPMNIAICTPER